MKQKPMHLLAGTEAAAFQRSSVMEQFFFLLSETCH
jgi:hypothetical protein